MKFYFTFIFLHLMVSVQSQSSQINIKTEIQRSIVLGDSAFHKGNFLAAETHFNSAREYMLDALKEKTSYRMGMKNLTIFDPLDRLGALYLESNNLQLAESYYQQSRSLRDEHLPTKSIFRVPPIVGLARIYLELGDYEKADSYISEAEILTERATSSWIDFDPIAKSIYTSKFEIALRKNELNQANKYLNRLTVGGFFSSDQLVQSNVPRILDMKARYYLHAGDFDEAERNLIKAEQFVTAISNDLLRLQIEKTRALFEWTKGNIIGAAAAFNRLTSDYKTYIKENFLSMTEYERESFYGKLRLDFDLFNAFAASQIDHEIAPELLEHVYNNQLFSKALLLNHLNKLRDNIASSGDDELISLVADWEKQKAVLSSLFYQGKQNSEVIETVQNRIQELEQLINSKSAYLNSMETEVSWKQIRGSLNNGEKALEIIRFNEFEVDDNGQIKLQFSQSSRYLFLAIDRESAYPKALIIENGEELEDYSLSRYRNSIQYKLSTETSYNVYWNPIKTMLEGAARVFISPDGAYNQINLNSLQNPVSKEYLLDEIDIVFVTNTKDLLQTPIASSRRIGALFGRPEYMLGDDLNPDRFQEFKGLRALSEELIEGFRKQKFADLPGTELEVKSIASYLEEKSWEVSANYGPNASETNLKKQLNPTVMHIATHGFFLKEDSKSGGNSMITSGIILSGVDSPDIDSNDDGILTAYEATNLKLDSTYLVVLSACETGLGQSKNGEGVYGLQRGFKVAGARYLIMSLWKVDDSATQSLMQKFYKEWLDGMKIHEAFKTAQIHLRESYPHPFYWGAFTLLGK